MRIDKLSGFRVPRVRAQAARSEDRSRSAPAPGRGRRRTPWLPRTCCRQHRSRTAGRWRCRSMARPTKGCRLRRPRRPSRDRPACQQLADVLLDQGGRSNPPPSSRILGAEACEHRLRRIVVDGAWSFPDREVIAHRKTMLVASVHKVLCCVTSSAVSKRVYDSSTLMPVVSRRVACGRSARYSTK